MNLYEILGVSKDADAATIKAAYRRAAQDHHPDREGGNADMFKAVSEAFSILIDPGKRRAYDEDGSREAQRPLEEEAQSTLLELFAALLDSQEDLHGRNPLKVITDKIRGVQMSNNTSIAAVNKKLEGYKALQGKFKRKVGQDLLSLVVEKNILDKKAILRKLNRSTMVGNEMIRLIEEYEFTGELALSQTTQNLYGYFSAGTRGI